MRRPTAASMALMGLALAGGSAYLAVRGSPRPSPPAAVPMTIAAPSAHWVEGGFAEMVPAIRLPTSLDGNDHITVWLRVPDGERIHAVRTDGAPALVYPPGTIADRVEMREPASVDGQHAWHVTDVRGTRLDDDGTERFHSLQPVAIDAPDLAGFEWRRGDADGERAATDGLADIVARRMSEAFPERRARIVERLKSLNDCASCHEHDRTERTRATEKGPRRATDSAGFYAVLSALGESAPLERHRPRDLNIDDAFVTVSCGDAPASIVRSRWGREYRCADDRVPVARLDLRRALAEDDPHAIAVCRSRRYLYEHMDAAARRSFAAAFSACGFSDPE